MDIGNALAILLAMAVLVYLMYALLRPEKF
jgi:K+-transporting ATPase KdpF subunit